VHLVRLSRNCGSHTAIYAGLAQCRGDAAVMLAADLQDPPELVGELLARWRQGDDIVWATRAAREGEKMSVRLTSRLYHFIFTHIALPETPAGGTDFFLMDRRIIDECLKIPEKNTDLMFLVQWMGFRQSMISYVKQGRASGKSKWTLGKRLKLAVDSIVSFSFTPIRVMSLLGIVFAVTGFMLAVVAIIGRLTGRIVANTGYVALATLLLIGFGLIMLMLGIIGEYLWRTFDEARGRPRFLIEERYPNHEKHHDTPRWIDR
jgi:glycosyltransferase involved in cell wall biosynthesis